MKNLVTYDLFEADGPHLIKVVRWASRTYTAAELKPQKFAWGGFEATGLCFTPVDGPEDPRMNAWKDILSKHHNKDLVPNFYYLDMSDFPMKTEKALTEFAELTYKSIKAEKLMKSEYKIHLSLSSDYPKPLIEIRLLEGCAIKILDYK